jgi:hypothetical protein
MKLIKGILINLLMLVVITGPAWGLSGARLIGQSSSGQTALFNLGIHDGVKEGDFAVIAKEIRNLETRDLRIVPVAKAKNIKISTNQSVWILYRIFDSDLLVKGEPYLILSESQMLEGRRDPRFGRISVITEKDKTAFQVKEALGSDKDRLAKLKTQYPEVMPLHSADERNDQDGDLLDVEGWKKYRDQKSRTALYKSPHATDFRRNLRLATFEKLVAAYLKKVNDPKFNYDEFYDEQMKAEFSNEFRQRSNFNSEYENFLSVEAQRAVSDAKLYRSILEKGGSWSQDFSDEELRSVLNQVSVLQEKDRRKYVIANPNRYSLYFSLGTPLNEIQTHKDAGYRREGRYSVELDFEGTPFLKHEVLEKFTVNATARLNRTATEVGGKNASVDETSFTGGVNWYPLYAPHSIEAPVFFLGGYFRTGWAALNSPSANEKANYTVLTPLGFRGGMKYNFKENWGLRLAFNLETMNLDRYEISKFNSIFPDQTRIAEAKFNFGVAYSF